MRRMKTPAYRRRAGDDVAAAQRQHAPDLGKARIVADHHAEPGEGQVDDGKIVARRRPGPVRCRDVGLAGDAEQAGGAADDGGIEQFFALTLCEPGDDVKARSPRQSQQIEDERIVEADGRLAR